MVLDREDISHVKGYIRRVFHLRELYQNTRFKIEELSGTNVPAGVVDDFDSKSKNKERTKLLNHLEESLYAFERVFLRDLIDQEDVADLLSDVRNYLYPK